MTYLVKFALEIFVRASHDTLVRVISLPLKHLANVTSQSSVKPDDFTVTQRKGF